MKHYEEVDCQQEAIAAWNSRVILDGCSKGFGWCENIDRGTSDNFYCANGKQLNKEREEKNVES